MVSGLFLSSVPFPRLAVKFAKQLFQIRHNLLRGPPMPLAFNKVSHLTGRKMSPSPRNSWAYGFPAAVPGFASGVLPRARTDPCSERDLKRLPSKCLELFFYVVLFSPYCPWKFQLLWLPQLCFLNLARLLGSAWDLEIASGRETTGLTSLFSFSPGPLY